MKYKFEKPVHGIIGNEKYQCTIEWRNGKFIADEPVTSGGKDSGPDPYTLLLSSLASCTLVTMRVFIDDKGWDIPQVAVKINYYQETKDEKAITIIDREIIFPGAVDEEQKLRLQAVAKHCPISKILENDIKINTFLFRESKTEVSEMLS
jgi:putative redox protein